MAHCLFSQPPQEACVFNEMSWKIYLMLQMPHLEPISLWQLRSHRRTFNLIYLLFAFGVSNARRSPTAHALCIGPFVSAVTAQSPTKKTGEKKHVRCKMGFDLSARNIFPYSSISIIKNHIVLQSPKHRQSLEHSIFIILLVRLMYCTDNSANSDSYSLTSIMACA